MDDAADLLARIDAALAEAPLAARPFGADALLIWADREDRTAALLSAAGQHLDSEAARALATALRNRVGRATRAGFAPLQSLRETERA